MATKHLEDFLDMTAEELKFYLRQRALTSTGTHSDLAARALVAFEHKLPIKESAEDIAKTLKSQYKAMLERFKIQQDPFEMTDWDEDLTKWPKTNLGSVFSYILNMKAFSTNYIGQYKIRKAYSYFQSGFVHQIYSKLLQDNIILLLASVRASQRVREAPHKLWIICKPCGEVLSAYCSCTAGYSKCCNHVVAVLYKIDYANAQGLTAPTCTDKACIWNRTVREIQPAKIKDMDIKAHKRSNPEPKFSLNNLSRKDFDPRPSSDRDITDEQKQAFVASVREKVPYAVLNISFQPPIEDDVPPPLQHIADNVVDSKPEASEEELVEAFSQKLSFSDASLKELEKATRGQSSQQTWVEQRKGRITASNYGEVYNKAKTLLKNSGKAVKTKVTPLLVKLVDPPSLDHVPAIKWGRDHEKKASEDFFKIEGKKHTNPKLEICGFFVSKAHPYLGASPDNVFVCSCCGTSCVEYKCPFSIKDKTIEEGWDKTDFLEKVDGKLKLKQAHKYYYQVQGQMAVSGYKKTYFSVWTTQGPPHIEAIAFDPQLWQDLLSKLIVFFKTYLQRVLLRLRPLVYCPTCAKSCLEPEEFEAKDKEDSIECESCNMWYHWECIGIKGDENSSFVCESCLELALDN